MKKLFLLAMICCCSMLSHAQQIDWNKALPTDNKTVVGKLPNGITYYLRHNEEPKDRASFYIIRNVGALLETDAQDGLAHFLEHMAFNGSKNFPGNGMIATLERHGISFGRNLNAYTTQTETVYNISSVPTTNEALVDTCLLILHDWSHYLTLADQDLDDERGVISEEWRSRRSSRMRIMEQQNKVLLKGSKYAERDVIGDLNVIKNFKYQEIRDFYHKWYRTDLEAIAIAGDFDVAQMEEKIKKVFSPLPAVENPEPRPAFFEIPEHDETYYVLATDKEATQSSVSIIRFGKDKAPTGKLTYQDIKDALIVRFYNSMISARIGELIQQGKAPYLGASVSKGGFVKGYEAYSISATAKPNQEKEALTAALQEHERVVQHGFSESELNRVKTNMMTGLESALKDIDKTNNESYIEDMQSHFLDQSAIVRFEDYYQAVKEILPTITTQEIADKAKEWWKDSNRTIIISGPSEGVTHLTEQEAKAIIAEVSGKPVEAYKDQSVSGDLITETLKGSPVVATKDLKEFDAVEWTLGNGAKVIFRKADFEKDAVSLSGYSAGGTSQYDVDRLFVASNATGFLGAYGLGDYDAITLRKLLTGKRANCGVSLTSLYENVGGSATPQDFETMLQLLYLRFQKPRFDADAHKVMLERSRISMEQNQGKPSQIINDSIARISSNYHPRTILVKPEMLGQLTIDKIEKVYRERFADASDFTFFIVGNIDAETAKPLVEKYIGSIESTNRNEKWIDHKVRRPEGKVEKVIEVELETPKTTVIVSSSKEMPYNLKESFELSILKAILDLRYTKNIREKEGGTYGVGVSSSTSREPVGNYTLSVQFDCDPDKASHLKSLVYAEFDRIIKDGVTEEEINKVVSNSLKEYEQSKAHNGYWMNALNSYYRTGINTTNPDNYENVLKALMPKDIQKFAKKFFKKVNTLDMMFVPKK